ncbi:TPA: hypothetical protein MBI04_003570 [Klebsiella pneumoniae]|nr:hypothetical protein [Klebsiella pneumoniae]
MRNEFILAVLKAARYDMEHRATKAAVMESIKRGVRKCVSEPDRLAISAMQDRIAEAMESSRLKAPMLAQIETEIWAIEQAIFDHEEAVIAAQATEASPVCDSNDTQINEVSTTEEAVQMVNVLIATNATFRDVPDNGVFSQAGTSPLSLYSYFWKTPEGEAANTVESTALSMNLLPVQFNPDDRVQVWGVANTWESVNDLISAHVLASRRVYIQNETDAERLAAFALSLPQADLASFLRMIQTHCTEEFTSEVLTAFHASVEPEIQERLNSLLHTAQA